MMEARLLVTLQREAHATDSQAGSLLGVRKAQTQKGRALECGARASGNLAEALTSVEPSYLTLFRPPPWKAGRAQEARREARERTNLRTDERVSLFDPGRNVASDEREAPPSD